MYKCDKYINETNLKPKEEKIIVLLATPRFKNGNTDPEILIKEDCLGTSKRYIRGQNYDVPLHNQVVLI